LVNALFTISLYGSSAAKVRRVPMLRVTPWRHQSDIHVEWDMRVRKTAGSIDPGRARPGGQNVSAPAVGALARAGGLARPADVTSIRGIPHPELTPRVSAALDELMAEVHDLRGALESARKRIAYLENLADRDALVPVLNRRAFVRELARMISFAERYGTPGSVLYFDIDGMKTINDTHGHGAGDAVLRHAAQALRDNLRGSDIVGRLGGDEFGVILAQADSASAALKAKALTREIHAAPLEWNGIALEVSVSFGIYIFAGGEAADEALNAADQAMYTHKRAMALAPSA